MKRIFQAAAAIAAVSALAGAPAMAQSSSGGSSATDQAGSQPGHEGVTGTSPRGSHEPADPSSGASSHKAKGTSGEKANSADHQFLMKAAEGGLAEVKLGQLATEKASSADVKRFGQMMVDDHSKANEELKSIATSQNVTPPASLKKQQQALYDRLSKLSGEQFDRMYMREMVEDHQKDVREFEKVSKTASDPSVKQFASSTLPTLQKHLQEARDIAAKLGGGAAGTSGSKDDHDTGPIGAAGSSRPSKPVTPPQR